MKEKISIFENVGTIVNIFGGFCISWFAAYYNGWILLLMIPQIFFMSYGIIFKNELKKKL